MASGLAFVGPVLGWGRDVFGGASGVVSPNPPTPCYPPVPWIRYPDKVLKKHEGRAVCPFCSSGRLAPTRKGGRTEWVCLRRRGFFLLRQNFFGPRIDPPKMGPPSPPHPGVPKKPLAGPQITPAHPPVRPWGTAQRCLNASVFVCARGAAVLGASGVASGTRAPPVPARRRPTVRYCSTG